MQKYIHDKDLQNEFDKLSKNEFKRLQQQKRTLFDEIDETKYNFNGFQNIFDHCIELTILKNENEINFDNNVEFSNIAFPEVNLNNYDDYLPSKLDLSYIQDNMNVSENKFSREEIYECDELYCLITYPVSKYPLYKFNMNKKKQSLTDLLYMYSIAHQLTYMIEEKHMLYPVETYNGNRLKTYNKFGIHTCNLCDIMYLDKFHLKSEIINDKKRLYIKFDYETFTPQIILHK